MVDTTRTSNLGEMCRLNEVYADKIRTILEQGGSPDDELIGNLNYTVSQMLDVRMDWAGWAWQWNSLEYYAPEDSGLRQVCYEGPC
jgi:hypothetical protein